MDTVYCLIEHDHISSDIDGWPITESNIIGVFRTFEHAFKEATHKARARKLYSSNRDQLKEIYDRLDDFCVCVRDETDYELYTYEIRRFEVKGE